ncbi:P-loop containing nucleoside triphosphate hydrolase protein [Macrophomina phaseolina]|uniref:P-loop containing nucleoside triphosphate hydrolase protein n=1 Tax=Macrophomina phaseolina TaxID=35725 RepID=A0ABQ8FTG9_9PEZI|nr:P-loop containing nucleoside triphosphate hydrolase protein [Macrophomina phaseolina]
MADDNASDSALPSPGNDPPVEAPDLAGAPSLDDVVGLPIKSFLEVSHSGHEEQAPIPSDGTGTICEAKSLFERESEDGYSSKWVEEYPEDATEPLEESSAIKAYAILLRYKKGKGERKKAVELDSVVVQSPLLKEFLKRFFSESREVSEAGRTLVFDAPFKEVWFRWEELGKEVRACEEGVREHLSLFYNTLNEEIRDLKRTLADLGPGRIIFELLWTLFPPGAIVYSKIAGHDRILRVKTTKSYAPLSFDLSCRFIDWDGDSFGLAKETIEIPYFRNAKSVQDLKAYPVEHHRSHKQLEEVLVERGKKFISLGGYHFMAYRGPLQGADWFSRNAKFVESRVIVDTRSFLKYTSNSKKVKDVEGNDGKTLMASEFSLDHLSMCSPILEGYCLKTKTWCRFDIDGIEEIKWNVDAFKSLVLPGDTKKLVLSFVKSHIHRGSAPRFDDFIEGKGQGIVFLLTGEPGVGKTLTAESVAEELRVPLYSISAAELGSSAWEVEETVDKLFDLCYRWNAVLLLDECDIFLERRTSADKEWSQLVLFFLRTLEYYRGILFLTTNRAQVSSFDPALYSRIHLTLNYPSFDQQSCKQVWKNFIDRVKPPANITSEELDMLSKRKMNGRQIKNIMRASQLLAADEPSLKYEHIMTVLRVVGDAYETMS